METQQQRMITRTSPKKLDDFFKTPEKVTLELLKHVSFKGEVWECACGNGKISEVLKKETDCKIYSSDLIDREYGHQKDFLLFNNRKTDNIVTNPPFKLTEQFLLTALELSSQKVAMLLPIRYLTGLNRKKIFDEYPLNKLIVIPYKIDFTNSGNPMFECAWYVWNKQSTKQEIIIGEWKP